MRHFNTCSTTEALAHLSDKERLLHFGYQSHHIIELPDGTALLDLDQIRLDLLRKKTL